MPKVPLVRREVLAIDPDVIAFLLERKLDLLGRIGRVAASIALKDRRSAQRLISAAFRVDIWRWHIAALVDYGAGGSLDCPIVHEQATPCAVAALSLAEPMMRPGDVNAAGPLSAGPLSPARPRQLSAADHMLISALWLALYTQWLSILPVVLPDQVATIVGSDNADKAGIAGTIAAAGAVMSLFVTPIAGALSDRLRAPSGRRRRFLITGTGLSCAALVPLAFFARGSSLVLYTLVILNLQIWWNWTAGAHAGPIPDIVPAELQPRASGWLNVMTIIGTILGNVLVWTLYRSDRMLPLIGVFMALNLGCLVLTLRGARETPAAGATSAFDLRAFVRSFFLDPRANANIYWVLITRLFANMGIWSVFTFLLFYIESVLGL